MATIKERKGQNGVSYLIRTYSGYDAHGKQIERTMTWKPLPGMTQRQLEKALNEAAVTFEKKVKEGVILDGNIRFSEFAEKWMQDYGEKQLAPKTRERYKALLDRINEAIGNIRIDKLQPHHLQAFYNNLGEEGIRAAIPLAETTVDLKGLIKKNKTTRAAISQKAGIAPMTVTCACQGKKITLASAQAIAKVLNTDVKKIFKVIDKRSVPLSDKTILHHHRLISAILQTAVQWQVIYDNPARRVKPPKVERKEAEYLEDTEAQKLVEALENAPVKWKTAVLLMLYSGMRRGELCGLEWKDIDFENNLIHIRRSSQYVSGMGIIEKSTKNFSSERVLKLPQEVFDLLKGYKAWQASERLKQGDRWYNFVPIKDVEGKVTRRKNNRIFVQENGLPMNPDSITGWIKKFRLDNNLPEFSPHTLRHTNISLMIAAGVPMRNISQRAGHAQLSTTQNIYAHAIKTADEKAAEAIGNILKPDKAIKKA